MREKHARTAPAGRRSKPQSQRSFQASVHARQTCLSEQRATSDTNRQAEQISGKSTAPNTTRMMNCALDLMAARIIQP